ncbi:SDR family NAD(P)-dependent oxidoreductase [Arthrobacter sp. Cr_A7]|uniref:SDR family NAD(P)-dependent oxidoreductase n=1 Tax=Arthrobacter sp. Cr_A7 TaxID=3031017 RepID=UPI0023DAC5DF|nr:SDR family NAD(P)-dependent oxidoreductase [Arthrobacter sp. Cr_A7]MDF2050419.1 SDR family NAD(P)-dependent oxidoreductase [Arthrobacter sp. Cr_A7]
MRGLNGKKIIVAGGASGIGAATAERLAEEGVLVTVGDINLDGACATVKRITDNGGIATPIEFDLSDEGSVNALVDKAIAEFGGVDGLYNVGADLSDATFGADLDLLQMDPAVWRRTFDVNVIGFAFTCRAVIPHLLEQGGGVIVNTSSASAQHTTPSVPAYAASKAAIGALTRSISATWGAKNIRCNAVSPGLVLTEKLLATPNVEGLMGFADQFLKVPNLAQPSEIASVVAFLLSDDSSYVSGQVWHANGGWDFHE